MLYSIENGKDLRITTKNTLTEAIKYALNDKNAKEIFEFNDVDTEIERGCVWKRNK